MRLTTPVARPWAALLAAALLTACTVPGDNDLNNQSAATPGVKVAEGALACPTDGASSLTFTDVAGTAVEGIGPGETVNEHEVEVPAGCPVNSLTFRIEWDNELEDLDIELKYAGDVVGSSGAFNALDGAFEEISLSDPAPGVYTLVVKSYLNIETSYRGSAEALASLACQPGDGKSAEIESGLLADLANAEYKLNISEVVDALQERESLGPTGVGHGVALPHARLHGLDNVVGLFLRLEKPLDFDAVDRQPVDLIFALLAPESSGVDHLKALALVSRTLRDNDLRAKLRANDDATALHAVLSAAQGIKAA